jgi:hypothetical protein
MDVTASVKRGTLVAALKVTNAGDEEASAVTPRLLFGARQTHGASRSSLPPGGTLEVSMALAADGLGAGQWPYRVTVDYADANGYPFQTLHAAVVSVGDPPPARVVVTAVEAAPLARSGAVRIRVKNLATVPRQPMVMVLVPEGLEVKEPVPPVPLEPWQEKDVEAEILNRAALPGSRYPVFVIAEYDEEGAHHAVVAHGMVEIRPTQRLRPVYPLAIAAGLVLAWLAVLAWRRTRRRVA